LELRLEVVGEKKKESSSTSVGLGKRKGKRSGVLNPTTDPLTTAKGK